MTERVGAIVALGLTVAGCGGGPSEAAASQQQAKTSRPTPKPARTAAPSNPRAGYFIPPEWGGSGQGNESPRFANISDAQALAIYLYQHPEALARLPVQREIVQMYSCGDADLEQSNEVRASEIRERYVAKLRDWLARAKPEGKAEYQVNFMRYDASRQSFGYRALTGQDGDTTTLGSMSAGGGSCASFSKYTGDEYAQFDERIAISGGRIPRVTVSPAIADRIIQTSGGSASLGWPVKVTAYFSIPKTPVGGSAPNNGSVTLTRADFSDDALKTTPGKVFASYRP